MGTISKFKLTYIHFWTRCHRMAKNTLTKLCICHFIGVCNRNILIWTTIRNMESIIGQDFHQHQSLKNLLWRDHEVKQLVQKVLFLKFIAVTEMIRQRILNFRDLGVSILVNKKSCFFHFSVSKFLTSFTMKRKNWRQLSAWRFHIKIFCKLERFRCRELSGLIQMFTINKIQSTGQDLNNIFKTLDFPTPQKLMMLYRKLIAP